MGESTSDRLLRETREAREAEQGERTRRMRQMSRDLISLLSCVPSRIRGDRPMEVNGWCHKHRSPSEQDLMELSGMMAEAAKQASLADLGPWFRAHYTWIASLLNEIETSDAEIAQAKETSSQEVRLLCAHLLDVEQELREARAALAAKG